MDMAARAIRLLKENAQAMHCNKTAMDIAKGIILAYLTIRMLEGEINDCPAE
ncbi:hypothetical protein SCACP_30300 [Sporomusa carbonis]|uniref:hypothetical protein n=1 Tax=Sporomusa carbonis TaxID=3076075 RepID=UPI003A73B321